jgi:beta-galactosidase
VAYQYRSIHTSASSEEAREGKVNVYNENFFIDLSRYMMKWNIQVDGKNVLSGVLQNLDVKPQQTAAVSLGYTVEDIREAAQVEDIDAYDVYLDVSYVLRRPDGLLESGTEVAYDQIALNETMPEKYDASSVTGLPEYSQDGDLHAFSGTFSWDNGRVQSWKAVFDAQKGTLSSYVVGRKEMVAEALMPCFGRAVTENDYGAKFHTRLADWFYPEFRVETFEVKAECNHYLVTTTFAPFKVNTVRTKREMIECVAELSLMFKVYADGTVEGVEDMRDGCNLAQAATLPRFGMEFAMPGEYSVLDFYGMGPFENYADRNSSAKIGRYTQRVEDQYHWGYARPQESGTRTELKWIRLTDDNGTGLMITSDVKFSASALPLSRRQLDMSITGGGRSDGGDQRHSLELRKLAYENVRSLGRTYVNFDLKQMGLGCEDSWGAWPDEKYLVKGGPMTFYFVISPVNN